MKKIIGLLLLFIFLVTTVSGAFAKQDNEKRGNGENKASEQVKIEAAQSTSAQQVTIEQTTEQQIENQLKELELQQKEMEKKQKEVIKQQKEVIKQKKEELKQQKEEIKQQKAEEKQQKAKIKATKKQEEKTIKQTFKINGSPVIQYGKFKLPIRPITKGLGATLQFSKETGVLTVVKDNTTIVIDFNNKTVTVNGVKDADTNIFTVKNSKKMTVLIKYIASELGIRVKVDDNKVTTETPQDNSPVVVTGSAITLN